MCVLFGTREEPGSLTQGAPVFPGSSRLGIEPKTPGWLVQDPITRPIGDLIPLATIVVSPRLSGAPRASGGVCDREAGSWICRVWTCQIATIRSTTASTGYKRTPRLRLLTTHTPSMCAMPPARRVAVHAPVITHRPVCRQLSTLQLRGCGHHVARGNPETHTHTHTHTHTPTHTHTHVRHANTNTLRHTHTHTQTFTHTHTHT